MKKGPGDASPGPSVLSLAQNDQLSACQPPARARNRAIW